MDEELRDALDVLPNKERCQVEQLLELSDLAIATQIGKQNQDELGQPIALLHLNTARIRLEHLRIELSEYAYQAVAASQKLEPSRFPTEAYIEAYGEFTAINEYTYEDFFNPFGSNLETDLHETVRRLKYIPIHEYGLYIDYGFLALSSFGIKEEILWAFKPTAMFFPDLCDLDAALDDWRPWRLWVSYQACLAMKHQLGTYPKEQLTLQLFWDVMMDVMIHRHPAHFEFRANPNYVEERLGTEDHDSQQDPPVIETGPNQ